MPQIGNNENLIKVADRLDQTALEATRLSKKLRLLNKAKQEFGLTTQQVDAKVQDMDVTGVQSALDEAKSAFLSQDVIVEEDN